MILSKLHPSSLAASSRQLALSGLGRFLIVLMFLNIRQDTSLFTELVESPKSPFK